MKEVKLKNFGHGFRVPMVAAVWDAKNGAYSYRNSDAKYYGVGPGFNGDVFIQTYDHETGETRAIKIDADQVDAFLIAIKYSSITSLPSPEREDYA